MFALTQLLIDDVKNCDILMKNKKGTLRSVRSVLGVHKG